MRLPDHQCPIIQEKIRLRIEEDATLSEIEAVLELAPIVATMTKGALPDQLRLRGRLRYTRRVECARCLAEVTVPVETAFESLVDLAAGTIEASDLEAAPEPGGFKRIGAGEIDFSEEIRQRVHLAAPEIAYCRPDCKGLCSRCGQDLNVRECACDRLDGGGPFAALKTLIEKH